MDNININDIPLSLFLKYYDFDNPNSTIMSAAIEKHRDYIKNIYGNIANIQQELYSSTALYAFQYGKDYKFYKNGVTVDLRTLSHYDCYYNNDSTTPIVRIKEPVDNKTSVMLNVINRVGSFKFGCNSDISTFSIPYDNNLAVSIRFSDDPYADVLTTYATVLYDEINPCIKMLISSRRTLNSYKGRSIFIDIENCTAMGEFINNGIKFKDNYIPYTLVFNTLNSPTISLNNEQAHFIYIITIPINIKESKSDTFLCKLNASDTNAAATPTIPVTFSRQQIKSFNISTVPGITLSSDTSTQYDSSIITDNVIRMTSPKDFNKTTFNGVINQDQIVGEYYNLTPISSLYSNDSDSDVESITVIDAVNDIGNNIGLSDII